MPPPLQHDLYVGSDREQSAKQDFVSSLRAYILNHMAETMKARYMAHVRPAFERAHGRAPADGAEVHEAIASDLYFKFYSAMRYNAQEMVWRSVLYPLDGHLAELNAKAAGLAGKKAAKTGGSLTLSPDMALPDSVTGADVHLAPGCYHTEYMEHDCGAGALYDHGVNVFSFGMMGANLDDIGHSMANYICVKFPDFKPRDILDMGCTVGHNTCPWALVYREAKVTGIDVAAPCLRYAHARAVAQKAPVHFIQMNATAMDFEDATFDVVFSSMFLHELPLADLRKVLAEAHRVLRPGGLLLNMELPPNSELEPYDSFYLDWDSYYNNERFYKKFRDQDYAGLCVEAGFEKEKFLSFIIPQYTYMKPDEFAAALNDDAGFDDKTGRLAEGIQWFGFGAWK